MYDFKILSALIALFLVIIVGGYTIFRCSSDKKNSFLVGLIAILFILVGHFIEITAANADQAFTGIRVQYIGSSFVMPFFLFFVADYCDFKIKFVFRAITMCISMMLIFVAWSTNITGLLYESFFYDIDNTRYLMYEPGKLSLVVKLIPLVYAIFCLFMLVRRIKSTRGRYRTNLMIILASIFVPYTADLIYMIFAIFGAAKDTIYLVPQAFSVLALLNYIGIVKYDMFDAIPLAAAAAMDTISDAFLLLDDDLSCLSYNRTAVSLFPWLPSWPKGQPVFTSPGWPEELSVATFDELRQNREQRIDYSHRVDYSLAVADDDLREFNANINPALPQALNTHNAKKAALWSVVIQDITESKNFVKRLEEAAYTDTLTGLYNRRHFGEIAAPFIERAHRLNTSYYVIICDLDLFKRVNDTYGHLAGDEVLRSTANILKTTMRSYDLLARWGGEEFIMLITDPDELSALSMANRLRQSIENAEFHYMEHTIKITISLGIAKNDSDCDFTELTRRADEALYASKQNGRNLVTLWNETEIQSKATDGVK